MKPEIWNTNWDSATMWDLHKLNLDGSIESYTTIAAFGAIAASMVGSIFSSDSWNNVTFIAGEIKNPQRNIGLSLALGTIIVTVIYVMTNVMYTGVLSFRKLHQQIKTALPLLLLMLFSEIQERSLLRS